MQEPNTHEKFIYLACPYSHPDRDVRHERFKLISKIAGDFMNEGYVVFSPISHSYPIAEHSSGKIAGDWGYWERFDKTFIRASEKVVVVMMDGWERSRGVLAEIEYATSLGIPVEFYSVKETCSSLAQGANSRTL